MYQWKKLFEVQDDVVSKLHIGVYMLRTDETEKSCVIQNVKLSNYKWVITD